MAEGRMRGQQYHNIVPFPPHPSPLPQGEGTDWSLKLRIRTNQVITYWIHVNLTLLTYDFIRFLYHTCGLSGALVGFGIKGSGVE